MSGLVAPVGGVSAKVLDAVLSRHLRPYLRVLPYDVRREVLRAVEAIHEAALAHERARHSATSSGGSAEAVLTETRPGLSQEIGTEQAATILGVTERRVCQLAAAWADEGLARKVGRSWLIDRGAVVLYRGSERAA